MEGPSREIRRRAALLLLTFLLAFGLAATSPAHDALHADEGGGHACVACHVAAIEAPPAARVAGRVLAPVGTLRHLSVRPLAVAPRPLHAPRGPPGV